MLFRSPSSGLGRKYIQGGDALGQALAAGGTSIGGLTKNGLGTLTLSNNNSYGTSALGTTVNGGTLALDLSSGSSSKNWLGGGVLMMQKGSIELRGGTQTEAFNAPNTGGGQYTISGGSFAVTRSSGTSKLRLNAMARNPPGTIDFAADNLVDTDTLNANGILNVSGSATVGSNTWAASAASGSDILIAGLPASGYVANGANLQGSTVSTSNLDMSTPGQDTTVTNAATVNSLRFNFAQARTITINSGQSLTLTSGGILNTANVGTNNNTITGGTLSFTAVHQHNTAGTLRNKKDLIMDFVARVSARGEIDEEWRAYVNERRSAELDAIIVEEGRGTRTIFNDSSRVLGADLERPPGASSNPPACCWSTASACRG